MCLGSPSGVLACGVVEFLCQSCLDFMVVSMAALAGILIWPFVVLSDNVL